MKIGGTQNKGDVSYFQRDLGICNVQRDHSYCRVPAGQIERQGRLGFLRFPRLEQMTTISKSIPRTLCNVGILRVLFHREHPTRYHVTCREKQIHTA